MGVMQEGETVLGWDHKQREQTVNKSHEVSNQCEPEEKTTHLELTFSFCLCSTHNGGFGALLLDILIVEAPNMTTVPLGT